MPPWVAKGKIGTLLLASEMPVPISWLRTVALSLYIFVFHIGESEGLGWEWWRNDVGAMSGEERILE